MKEKKQRIFLPTISIAFMVVAVAVLYLIGNSFVQAQVKTQKGKPPGTPGKEEATWAVQIPAGSMLLGKENEYVDNGKDIIVSVEKKGWKTVGKGGVSGIYYCFLFKLVNPTSEYAAFSDVVLTANHYGENACVFPGECGSIAPPRCMQCFLSQQHPYSSGLVEYDHVYIKFWIWYHEIEDMEPGDIYKLGDEGNPYSGSDRIRIKIGYTPVNTCFREEPSYHDIVCQKYAEDEQLNTYIEKLSENTWRIHVGDDTDAILPVYETYCIEEKQRGWVSKTVKTLEATGKFSFVMDWIKNPQ
jgi:hypothetical protein